MNIRLQCQSYSCYRALLPKAGKPASYIKQLDKAISSSQNSPAAAAKLCLALGILKLQDFDCFASANYCFKQALLYDPNCGPAYLLLAQSNYERGIFEEASIFCQRAKSLMPGDPDPHIICARMFFQTHFYQKATVCFTDALKLNPTCYEAMVSLAECYLARGVESSQNKQFFDRSAELLAKAEQLYPSKDEAIIIRAKLALARNKLTLADQLLAELLDKRFNFEALKLLCSALSDKRTRYLRKYSAFLAKDQQDFLGKLARLDNENIIKIIFFEALPQNSPGYKTNTF
jgi:hypothetical protein